MKNYKKYQPDTQENNTVELPSPEAVADILAAEILTNINEHGRVINRRILRKSIINGLAKLALVTIAADDDTNDTRADDNAPVDPTVARKDIMDAICIAVDAVEQAFISADMPIDLAVVKTEAAFAAKDTFDRYFIR